MALLRDLPPGVTLSIAELGPLLKQDWKTEELPWLIDLAQGLVADRLVFCETELSEKANVRLP